MLKDYSTVTNFVIKWLINFKADSYWSHYSNVREKKTRIGLLLNNYLSWSDKLVGCCYLHTSRILWILVFYAVGFSGLLEPGSVILSWKKLLLIHWDGWRSFSKPLLRTENGWKNVQKIIENLLTAKSRKSLREKSIWFNKLD